jgi:hypothetical protein
MTTVADVQRALIARGFEGMAIMAVPFCRG